MDGSLRWDQRHDKGFYSYLQSDKFKCVYQYASKRILEHRAESTLDVGCWTGMLAEALLESGFSGDYLGVDISGKALHEASQTYRSHPRFKFLQHDFNGPPPRGRHDAMYFGGVFYYIEDKASFLNKFIENNDPSVIVIQDLTSTDLGFLAKLKCIKRDVKYFQIALNVGGSESRNERQIHTIRLK